MGARSGRNTILILVVVGLHVCDGDADRAYADTEENPEKIGPEASTHDAGRQTLANAIPDETWEKESSSLADRLRHIEANLLQTQGHLVTSSKHNAASTSLMEVDRRALGAVEDNTANSHADSDLGAVESNTANSHADSAVEDNPASSDANIDSANSSQQQPATASSQQPAASSSQQQPTTASSWPTLMRTALQTLSKLTLPTFNRTVLQAWKAMKM